MITSSTNATARKLAAKGRNERSLTRAEESALAEWLAAPPPAAWLRLKGQTR